MNVGDAVELASAVGSKANRCIAGVRRLSRTGMEVVGMGSAGALAIDKAKGKGKDKVEELKTKVANFQDKYHYPIDEDEYVNAPIENGSGSAGAIGGLIGGTMGAAGGALIGMAVKHPMRGMGIGALVGGLGLGASMYNKVNKQYKADIANPDAVYARRKEEFARDILPEMHEHEDQYIDAIEDNAHNFHSHQRRATLNAGIGAIHAIGAVNKDENGGYHANAYHAATALSQAHSAYEDMHKAKEQKSEYERMKARTPEERLAEEQAIRTSYRNLRSSRREDEHWNVVYDGKPSRLTKRAGLTGAPQAAQSTTPTSTPQANGVPSTQGKLNSLKPIKQVNLGTGV